MLKRLFLTTLLCYQPIATSFAEKISNGFSKTRTAVQKTVKKENRSKTAKAFLCGSLGAGLIAVAGVSGYICKDIIVQSLGEKEKNETSLIFQDQITNKEKIKAALNRQNLALCSTASITLLSLFGSYKSFKKSYTYLKETQKD